MRQEGWETLVEIGHEQRRQATWVDLLHRTSCSIAFSSTATRQGQQRCIGLNGRDVTVPNSYVSGARFSLDAQAIGDSTGRAR